MAFFFFNPPSSESHAFFLRRQAIVTFPQTITCWTKRCHRHTVVEERSCRQQDFSDVDFDICLRENFTYVVIMGAGECSNYVCHPLEDSPFTQYKTVIRCLGGKTRENRH